MNTRTTTHLCIVSLIFLNLPILLAIIAQDDQESLSNPSQTVVVHNDSETIISDNPADSENILEPSIEVNYDAANADFELDLTDNTTESSDTATRILHNDTPVLLTLDSSTVDVEQVVEVSLVLTSQHDEIPPHNIAVQTENIPINISSNISQNDVKKHVENIALEAQTIEKNITEEKSEDIPSFSEWAQKRLEEVEKKEQTNISTKGQTVNGKGANAKLRWKNYASLDCGAKVAGSNAEAVSPGSILSLAADEYKLNPCTSRIWFVVELCEAIQAQRIDLANYELFSSSPKDFIVSVSERYPTRDWAVLGKFTAKDERDIQSFDIDTQLFGKYIKVEIKSHYGTEHYCPISLFRAYGMSVFEVLQKEDSGNTNPTDEEDDDDDDEDSLSADYHPDNSQKNLFSSATDAVISMVKRAAGVLGNKVDNDTVLDKKPNACTLVNTCSSPIYSVVCNNCSDTLFVQIYELLSCRAEEIRKLVSIPAIFKALIDSEICRKFGYHFGILSEKSNHLYHIEAFFPEKYVGAMCNEAAILENQGLLNVSQQFLNITKSLTKDKIINMDFKDVEEPELKSNTTFPTDNTTLGNITDIPSTTVDEDVSRIKPTKTFAVDPELTQTDASAETATFESVKDSSETTTAPYEVTIDTPLNVEVDVTTEAVVDVLEENVDNIISDINIDSQTTTVSSSTASNSPQAPKESIFLRLSNRIKALERNMSLSGQYLEELSKRYKKQVEEMQLLLKKPPAHFGRNSAKDRTKPTSGRQPGQSDVFNRATNGRKTSLSICGLSPVVFWSKKRKKKLGKRSNSAGSLKMKDEDWVENNHQVIEDIPFLDESDNLTLECQLPNDFSKAGLQRAP
ncbi:hypothetical protein JTB14_009603 [Gonioctena quinquepunctata]|nr:hypothetical protein JTB14_009603 [Gonioctena quinquepunctata]